MSDILTKYTEKIQIEIFETEKQIATLEGRRARLLAKLKAPLKALAEEQKKGTNRFKKASGLEVPKRTTPLTSPKKDQVPAAASLEALEEKKEEKKSSWGGLF